MSVLCRPKPLQSTFCLKTFNFTRALHSVPVSDFFGDPARLRSRKGKPLLAAARCKSVHSRSSLEVTHAWQQPELMDLSSSRPHHIIEVYRTTSWEAKQSCSNAPVILLCLAAVLIVARTLSTWQPGHASGSKSISGQCTVDVTANAHM